MGRVDVAGLGREHGGGRESDGIVQQARRVAGCPGSRSSSRARPATSASPAPVGLPASTAAGRASQTPVAVAATTPSAPSEATTVASDDRASVRAARTGSSSPVVAASSWTFGLTTVAPAASAESSHGPWVSTTTGSDRRRPAATRTARPSAGTPSGTLPLTTRTSASARVASTAARISGQQSSAAGSTSVVGSVPSRGTTVTVRRVGWSVATRVASSPVPARPRRSWFPVPPPAGATSRVGSPSRCSTRATLTALPPGRSVIALTRVVPLGCRWSTW